MVEEVRRVFGTTEVVWDIWPPDVLDRQLLFIARMQAL